MKKKMIVLALCLQGCGPDRGPGLTLAPEVIEVHMGVGEQAQYELSVKSESWHRLSIEAEIVGPWDTGRSLEGVAKYTTYIGPEEAILGPWGTQNYTVLIDPETVGIVESELILGVGDAEVAVPIFGEITN